VSKFPKQYANEDGWCDWISPSPKRPYKMACCDCGLVHDLEFEAVEIIKQSRNGWWQSKPMEVAYRVLFRARRNERDTKKLRARAAL
jgi:hypothetical protein